MKTSLCSSKGFVREMDKRGFTISVKKLHRLLKRCKLIHEDGFGYKSDHTDIKSVWSKQYTTHYLLFSYDFIQKYIYKLPKKDTPYYTYRGVCSPLDYDWDSEVKRSEVEAFKGLWTREAYRKYLSSNRWSIIRGKAMTLLNSVCYLCGKDYKLTVHHKSYLNVAFETRSEVVVLCSDCHAIVHNKIDDTELDPRKYPPIGRVNSFMEELLSTYEYCEKCKKYTHFTEINHHEITCSKCETVSGYGSFTETEIEDTEYYEQYKWNEWEYWHILPITYCAYEEWEYSNVLFYS